MSAVGQEGMLVVFASPLENVPYTLAEVAVAGTPLLTFDVGGASELIDPKTHEDLFCGLPSVRTPLATCHHSPDPHHETPKCKVLMSFGCHSSDMTDASSCCQRNVPFAGHHTSIAHTCAVEFSPGGNSSNDHTT
jgi:hypothetical protein